MAAFSERVVVITGGGSGIGAATAAKFIAEGANVVISGRNQERLEKTKANFPPNRVLAFAADVSKSEECEALVAAAVERFGRIDTLVNNAGANIVGTVEQTSEATWRECLGADLDSVFFMIRAALPQLIQSKGSVINIGSVSSLGGGWSHAAYCAAKAAVANLTRSVACDVGKHGVRANTVCPGLTITDMVSEIMKDDALLDKAWERIPLRRAGKPDEIASAVFFLASDQASFITGVALPVDGGQTCTDGGPEWGK